MLCAERQRADDFDQIDRLASGHECNWFAVDDCGNAIFAVITVTCQRKRQEIFVVQMQRQRNFLLFGRCFVREAAHRQGALGVAETEDIKGLVVIRPRSFRILIIFILGRVVGKGISQYAQAVVPYR